MNQGMCNRMNEQMVRPYGGIFYSPTYANQNSILCVLDPWQLKDQYSLLVIMSGDQPVNTKLCAWDKCSFFSLGKLDYEQVIIREGKKE